MKDSLGQLDVLLGTWTSSSKRYPEGRGQMTVAPTEEWEFSKDGKTSEVDFDLTYRKAG